MKSINDIRLKSMIQNKEFTQSPIDWENQIIYFLLIDRFSDANEEKYKVYDSEVDYECIFKNGNLEEWESAATKWNGGTLKGVKSKLQYLKKLGITTIWLSPILKQPIYSDNYHGYGTQNFLEIDPHIGSKEDLIDLVESAHALDIYVIMDVIINHTGDIFSYKEEQCIYNGQTFPVKGFRDEEGNATLDFVKNINYDINSAIWPVELQDSENFYRKGQINDWETYPEYVEGDFMTLKTLNLGSSDEEHFDAPESLNVLIKVFKYWIALADLDGFRIDTVKHVKWEATNHFTQSIHEFSKSIGKDNFYLIGEITGGMNFAIKTLKKTGLDAALGINNIPEAMEKVAKGYEAPETYFDIFSNSEILGDKENLWYKDKIVTMFDDHDMVSQDAEMKQRFTADTSSKGLLLNCLFLNVFTSGIPCIYYGTEQGFDGNGPSDKYIRENMFGKKFGAFRTQNRHFFDESSPIYIELSRVLAIRKRYIALKHGRQFLREISKNNEPFHYPKKIGKDRISTVVCWSKIFNDEEFVLAINTDTVERQEVYVKIDPNINSIGDAYEYLYSDDKVIVGNSVY
jgi:glycosidase